MRIGVNGRFHGVPVWGVQRFAREISARLPALADVTLLLPGGVVHPRRPPTNGVGAGVGAGAGERGAGGPGGAVVVPGRLPGHLWEQIELPWRARRAGCDVLLHMSGTAPIRGGGGVVAIHDVFPLTHPEWFGHVFVHGYRIVIGRAARRAAVILAPSAWAASEIVRVLRVPKERVRVVGQGVEPFHVPASMDEVRRARERFGLPQGYLLAMGGGDRRKNVAFLRRVLARWAERTGDPPVLVVVGARRARVHGRAKAPREAGGRILELGYVTDDELRALYTGARVFCFPSLGEGFGRPPLEAMACGTPAVVAPYGCAREVLGEAALILPLAVDAWVEGIASLMGGTRRERILAGERHARAFRWETAAADVLAACRTAVEGAPRVPAGRDHRSEPGGGVGVSRPAKGEAS